MTELDAASASNAAPAAHDAFAEPVRRVGAGWIAAFASAWLGIWMAQLTPVQLLLPAQVDERLHPEDWVDSVVAFGAISGVAALATIIAYPLTGALSDRTTSRFGRRRPWILVGALVFATALVVLGFQSEMWAIGAAWVAASVGFCIMTAALTATISDRAEFGNPHQYAVGVSYVIVNGQLVLDGGSMTEARPGAALYGAGRKSR